MSYNQVDSSTRLPYFTRIGSRGNCAAAMSNSSAFDLYSIYNVNADPFATISAVRQALLSNLVYRGIFLLYIGSKTQSLSSTDGGDSKITSFEAL